MNDSGPVTIAGGTRSQRMYFREKLTVGDYRARLEVYPAPVGRGMN
jgi:hypothetical protein